MTHAIYAGFLLTVLHVETSVIYIIGLNVKGDSLAGKCPREPA